MKIFIEFVTERHLVVKLSERKELTVILPLYYLEYSRIVSRSASTLLWLQFAKLPKTLG
jgi:hypothetical protein